MVNVVDEDNKTIYLGASYKTRAKLGLKRFGKKVKSGVKIAKSGGEKILKGPKPETRRKLKVGYRKLTKGTKRVGRIAGKGLRSASRGVKKLQVQTKPKGIQQIDANKIFRL